MLAPDPPQFIIIGAQKSASSFLQVCLSEHPAIWMPIGETAHFESPDYEAAAPGALPALFASRPEPVCGIKRPNYLGLPEVPPRIAADCPEAKLIVVLRNPVDRALSAYFHLIKSGFLPPIPVEKGLNAIFDDPAFLEKYPRAAEILEFGLYHKHLLNYQSFAERERLLVMLHDDILASPRECIRRTFEYLEVDAAFVPEEGLVSRPQSVVYSLSRLRLLSWRPRLLYTFDARRSRMTGKRANPLARGLAALIVGSDRVLWSKIMGNAKPKLSDKLRQKLRDYYRQDIQQLQDKLGRDLSNWK